MPKTLALSAIPQLRLRSQWIHPVGRSSAPDVVHHLVAVQSQDFAAAKWALGLRLRGATESRIEQAFNEGRILRTHVLRPTWHFVTPRDIRWLLALTGPRVQMRNAGMYRRAGLDAGEFQRAEAELQRALRGGSYLTRDELRGRMEAAGIAVSRGFRMECVLMHAELVGLVCSGPRRGKQLTYALLDERVPAATKMPRDAALIELARRYFLSRGPATPHDFVKWSGLTLADARLALEAIGTDLRRQVLDAREYWFAERVGASRVPSPQAHLLSVYDEYLSSYRGHTAIAPAEISRRLRLMANALSGVILLDGMIVGTWKRTLTKDSVIVRSFPFGKLTSAARSAISSAAQQYAAFHGLRAVLA